VSAIPKDVGIVEGGLAFCAFYRGAMFSTTTVYMDPPCYFTRVLSRPVGGGGVSVNALVCSSFYSFANDGAIYGVFGAECGVVLRLDDFVKA